MVQQGWMVQNSLEEYVYHAIGLGRTSSVKQGKEASIPNYTYRKVLRRSTLVRYVVKMRTPTGSIVVIIMVG